ncbi:MAG: flagellar protein FlaG [Rhodocyclaceae bacterium]|nr:flagellar protein FlaG [Rhodocyclaceae bacterium]
MAITLIGNAGASPPKPQRAENAPAQAAQRPESAILTDASASPSQPPKPETVEKAIASMRELVESKAPNSLQFSIDETTGKTVVKITDATTGETIRQIPAEELLAIARSLDKLQGLLLRQEA